LDKLIELIKEETGCVVDPSTQIDSLGIDSLDFIALVQAIRSEIGPLDLNKAAAAMTVGDLLKVIGA